MMDDAELLRRYAEVGDQEAFAELVRRHVGFVYGSALRQVRDAHAAKDVAQTVFADLARQAGRVCRQPVILGWLYTAVRRAAANLRRSEGRRAVREAEALKMDSIHRTTGSEPSWEDLRPFLDEAMHELPAGDREALLLRFFQSRSLAAVASPLRISEDAARKRVDRALGRLRLALARRGIVS